MFVALRRHGVVALAALSCAAGASAQDRDLLGEFERLADVGGVQLAGTATYDRETQEYTLTASGANVWGEQDSFSYLFSRVEGDFIVRARVDLVGWGAHPHRKTGWMVRRSLDPGSPHVSAAVHGDGLASLQYRPSASAETSEVQSSVSKPDIVQLERVGDTYTLSVARFGEPFVVTGTHTQDLGASPYVGLFVCSHDRAVLERVIFSNVRIVRPAWAGLVPYRDYLGSRLEVMDVATGKRRVLLTATGSLQAPNWTRDGKALIYNSEGRLFRFDLETRVVSAIDTGFATRNNNDHVLSWDGTSIGISHHDPEDGGASTLYTLPLGGSAAPVRITARGAGDSYLHGFSPDDERLVFTGFRRGKYDVWEIDLRTRSETQLTDTPALDDGAEYSPDGRHIHFNSNRTGTMQLWRMKADGSDPVQLTHDAYHDWFPHPSPDGSRVAFLSYRPDDVESGDHPFYRQVYLRLMPAAGGPPRVIGYLYGGQGTINVASWSPDGRQIAFVSNTAVVPRPD
jgi:Tol biopolymer transport system component